MSAPPVTPAAPPAAVTAKLFRAFGEPTRLRIVQTLADGERSVGELVAQLDVPQPQVSNHLACLRWCGLVSARREHRHVFYSVADERVSAVVALVEALATDNAEHVDGCQRIDGRGR